MDTATQKKVEELQRQLASQLHAHRQVLQVLTNGASLEGALMVCKALLAPEPTPAPEKPVEETPA